ncbi:Putative 2-hydroxyacid dehydrogenase SAV2305 [uncultured Clostridium sp.]|nr:Putative 2-hydroxyacid dehydrogenase SAV2305 [uncultured Clostridium sp.]
MQPNIYVTRELPEKPMAALRKLGNVICNPEDRMLTHEELIKNVAGMDAVLCLLTDPIDEAVLKAAGPQCKIFANYAVGYNNIDITAATDCAIWVSNTPGVLTEATADIAWALLFSCARRIVEGDRYMREGRFTGWAPKLFLGQDITGATVGVVGAGRIGGDFARKAKAFGMKVIYHNRRRDEALERDCDAEWVTLPELLQRSDYVSLHVPLTMETKHLIGEKELKMMKPTAILINTARGPVVDEKALAKALKEGTIWAAGLDVFENEPEYEMELRDLPNVTMMPHVASATIATRDRMGMMCVENIQAALSGKLPPNCLNPDARSL